ncbi:MAG: hypothetical protein VYA34_13120 [Myxococcota bacterium]|nr:hypothetical protein [Myxococcota bacterium]
MVSRWSAIRAGQLLGGTEPTFGVESAANEDGCGKDSSSPWLAGLNPSRRICRWDWFSLLQVTLQECLHVTVETDFVVEQPRLNFDFPMQDALSYDVFPSIGANPTFVIPAYFKTRSDSLIPFEIAVGFSEQYLQWVTALDDYGLVDPRYPVEKPVIEIGHFPADCLPARIEFGVDWTDVEENEQRKGAEDCGDPVEVTEMIDSSFPSLILEGDDLWLRLKRGFFRGLRIYWRSTHPGPPLLLAVGTFKHALILVEEALGE